MLSNQQTNKLCVCACVCVCVCVWFVIYGYGSRHDVVWCYKMIFFPRNVYVYFLCGLVWTCIHESDAELSCMCFSQAFNILCCASGFYMLLFLRQMFVTHVCVCGYVCVCVVHLHCSAQLSMFNMDSAIEIKSLLLLLLQLWGFKICSKAEYLCEWSIWTRWCDMSLKLSSFGLLIVWAECCKSASYPYTLHHCSYSKPAPSDTRPAQPQYSWKLPGQEAVRDPVGLQSAESLGLNDDSTWASISSSESLSVVHWGPE